MEPIHAFDRGFLEARSRLLDLAAWLDRAERQGGSDPRSAKIAAALEILRDGEPDRAERVQALFSRPYDPQWTEGFAPLDARGGTR